jgi:radical SAM protein
MTAHPTAATARETDARRNFAASPLVVIWEVTRACDLECVHCRASAIAFREKGELSTEEGKALIREIKSFGKPLMVFTGGDPLKRADLQDLIAFASEGLATYLSPSGTPLLTHAALRRAKENGLRGVSISLDGSSETIHDAFRGVRGSFRWSIEGAAAAVGLGLGLQINTTVSRDNLRDLPAIAELAGGLEARRWTLFLLVPTGRGKSSQQITPQECEELFEWLADLAPKAPFRIKTTEGPHYRRIVLQRRAASPVGPVAGGTEEGAAGERDGRGAGASADGSRVRESYAKGAAGRFVPGMNDGSGFVFISSRGEIHPSGFLPLSAGNVRRDSLVRVYREHPLFLELRDPDRLKGRCGVCEFRGICGGSRARAYSLTGDPFAEDPACLYQPAGPAGKNFPGASDDRKEVA